MADASKNTPAHVAYLAFFTTVDEQSAAELVHTIATRLPENTRTLYLLLSLNGGAVEHGIALYNILRALPFEIIIHNIGNVDSIGNTIFMAGDKRYATPNATFMLHKVSCKSDRQDKVSAGQLHEKLSSIRLDERRIRRILQEHSKLTDADLDAFFREGETVDAHYALEKGIIHEIRELSLHTPQIMTISGSPPPTEG